MEEVGGKTGEEKGQKNKKLGVLPKLFDVSTL